MGEAVPHSVTHLFPISHFPFPSLTLSLTHSLTHLLIPFLSIMLSLFTLFALALLAPALAENATLSDPVTGKHLPLTHSLTHSYLFSCAGATARVLGQSGKIDFELDDQTMQVVIVCVCVCICVCMCMCVYVCVCVCECVSV
jgi:hypothetical protein